MCCWTVKINSVYSLFWGMFNASSRTQNNSTFKQQNKNTERNKIENLMKVRNDRNIDI